MICAAPSSPTQSGTTRACESATNSGIQRVPTPFVFGRNPTQLPPAGISWRTAWWKARAYLEWTLLTADSSWHWGEAAVRQVDPSRDYDVMIVDAPPVPGVVPFTRLAARLQIPVVMDLRDLWIPDRRSTMIRWHPSPQERRHRWSSHLVDEAIGVARRVVLTSEATLQVVRDYFPDRPSQDFLYVPNAYATVDEVAGRAARSPEQPLRVVYTGSLAYGREAQAIDLVRAMGFLRRKRGAGVVQFIVAGAGGEALLGAARTEGVADDFELRGWVAEDEAVQLQRSADALLLLQPPDKTIGTRIAIPAKLFEYMERRRHILGMLGPGPSARLIEENDLGLVVSTKEPGGIARTLEELESRVRQNPILPRPPEAYSEDRTVATFAEVLDGLTEDSCDHPTDSA